MESCLKALAVISLLCAGIKLVNSQCYTDQDDYTCSGTNMVVGSGTIEECCLGPGFSFMSGGDCDACIVAGWVDESLRAPETQTDYVLGIAYSKLPPDTAIRTVVFEPELILLEDEASVTDVEASTAAVRITASALTPTTTVDFVVDSIGMEPDELATLRLNIIGGSLIPGAIFRSDIMLVIQDNDIVEIALNAGSYGEDESSSMNFQVFKDIEIATPIDILIKPLSFSEYQALDEDGRPPLQSAIPQPEMFPGGVVPVYSPIEATPVADYDPATISLRFEADEGALVNNLPSTVPLVDDSIDETDLPGEYFIITLNVTQALNRDLLDLSGFQASLAAIADNDVLRIGFERNSYIVDEPAGEIFFDQITLRKNIVTEQTYLIALATSSEGSNPATGGLVPMPSGSDPDIRDYISFTPAFVVPIFPDQDSITLGVTIFGDLSPEGDEQFRITASPSDLEGPQFTPPGVGDILFRNTIITIRDDDNVVLAWERNLTLAEGQTVSDQACYSVVPPDLVLPDDFMLLVYVDTVDITAIAPGDYNPIRAADFEQERLITNANKRHCVTVNANTDSSYEFDEVYQLNIVPDPFTDTSNIEVQNFAQVTINDTTEVQVGFINPPYSAQEDMGPMMFQVGVTNGVTLERDVSFTFSTEDVGIGMGFATADVDYNSQIGTQVNLGAGAEQLTINVGIIDDNTYEGDEVFRGALDNLAADADRASFSIDTATATIIEDEVVCDPLDDLVNGVITYNQMIINGAYPEGTEATHVCNPGFFLQGVTIRTCQNDSFFDMDPPMCVPIQCPPLDPIGNGSISYSMVMNPVNYDIGTIATYSCNPGFVLNLIVGAETRECVDDEDMDAIGIFNRQAPTCVPIIIEWEQDYRVEEGVEFEACYRFVSPPANAILPATFALSVDTNSVDASAMAEGDYDSIDSIVNSMRRILTDAVRRACVNVMTNTDNSYENEENFFLDLDPADPDVIVINRAQVSIIDINMVIVGFIDPPYEGFEEDRVMTFMVGVIGNTILERDVFIDFTTLAQTGPGGNPLATAGADYISVNAPGRVVTLTQANRVVNVDVTLFDDTLVEGDEDFSGQLMTDQERVTIPVPTAVATILERDFACDPLDDLVNGVITYSEMLINGAYPEGTEATHVCNPGFFLQGVTIRTCQNDSLFDMDPPMCIPIECDPLDMIPNGMITYSTELTISGSYSLTTVATYTCDDGFFLDTSGADVSATRTCVDDMDGDADGIFENQPPRCVPVECEPVDGIDNGMVTYSMVAGVISGNYALTTVATYTCNDGFFLDISFDVEASATRTCIDDMDGDALGIFDMQPPRCVPVECEPVDGIDNGMVTYSMMAEISGNYALTTVATYTCDDGFFLDTSGADVSATRTCIDDFNGDALGIFDRQPPRCVRVVCDPLGDFENGMITYSTEITIMGTYTLNTVATYECNDGFYLSTRELGASATRTCIDDMDGDDRGIFDMEPPTCIPIVCPPLPPFTNGMITYNPDVDDPNFPLGTNATYSCDEGYFLDVTIGDEIRTCEDMEMNDEFGEFSGQEPRCVPVECEPVDGIDNGMVTYSMVAEVSGNYALTTVATYTCDDGFFLDTSGVDVSATRTCVDDMDNDALGIFDRQPPRCVPVECDPLAMIDNGVITYSTTITVSGSYSLTTVATYMCNDGYFLETSESGGSATRTCIDDMDGDADGEFDNQPPTCVPIECEPLPGIPNGMITYSMVAGVISGNYALTTVATYTCEDGFFLDTSEAGSSATRTCIDDMDNDALGEFNMQPPRCVPIECEPLPGIMNGMITYSVMAGVISGNYALTTVATYTCNDGFFLDTSGADASATRTCVDDMDGDALGEFDRQPPMCIPIVCDPLDGIVNGRIEYSTTATSSGQYVLTTVATYICSDGFRLDLSEAGSSATRTCIDDMDNDALGEFDMLPPRCVPERVTVNDTVTGDPLFTVPLYVPDKSAITQIEDEDPLNLCFEVHGQDDAYFNLVSDACVSVNAHYAQVVPTENVNIVDEVNIHAPGLDCVSRDIQVNLDGCSATIDGVPVDNFISDGITVRRYPNRVRIVVPNCNDIDLVMWVMCLNQTFWSRASTPEEEVTFVAEMLRFVIARGLDLSERSHGLLGQFWNIEIQVEDYTGPVVDDATSDGYYTITTNHPDEGPRQFIGWLWPLTWEYRPEYCLYAGQFQAGPLFEILDQTVNQGVIFGSYEDYIVSGPFETSFAYSHYDPTQCIAPTQDGPV